MTQVSGADELRRYHLHANDFGVHLREAVDRLGTHKKVSAHTFRHSFASHLMLANYDIKTIQEMLGHSDVRTTMIYVQTVPSRTSKDGRARWTSLTIRKHEGVCVFDCRIGCRLHFSQLHPG
ncbi:MAG: tyrosine-type recombinase/integrase [Verrucomicrobiae bacterium]|nr:tyrosine-type recombinase/integrase [Verrucomicrobiae bacterium]